MAKKFPKYHTEPGKSEGGTNGWLVLDNKGREAYFDTSEAEARNRCAQFNGKTYKQFHFSLGNSSKGPIGFCALLKADSKKDAVALLKKVLPDELEIRPLGNDKENAAVIYIAAYFNDKAITVRAIDEEEEVSE